MNGWGLRGMDIDRNGVVWSSLASGQPRELRQAQMQRAVERAPGNRQALPGRLALYPFPGPQFENVKTGGSVEASYYTWVDQFDTFGLGKDVPIATGNLNDGLLALGKGEFVTLRVPTRSALREVDGRAYR